MVNLKSFCKNDKGFTLVELIVVIVILAILIGVSVSGYSKYIGQSKLHTDVQNAEIVRTTLANATAADGVYEQLIALTSESTLVVTIDNYGATISGTLAGDNALCNEVKKQLGLNDTAVNATIGSATKDAKLKTQLKDGAIAVTLTATVVDSKGTGEATVRVAESSSSKYPAGTF